MNLSYLWIGAAVVSVVLFVRMGIRGSAKTIKLRAEKLGKAAKAKAMILSYREHRGGRTIRGRFTEAIVRLRVQPEQGENYETEAHWCVYRMAVPFLRPGQEVDVKIDADDPSVVYPDLHSVEYYWKKST